MADILAENPIIYNHWNPNSRDEVHNLQDLPMVDSTGKEQRIYDPEGVKISRRRVKPTDAPRTFAGILMDIRGIDSLFQRGGVSDAPAEDDNEDDEDAAAVEDDLSPNPPQLDVYPQAFTGKWGHFQANRLMYHFDEPLRKINQDIRESNSDRRGNSILITPDSCQGYNELSHRTAPRAGGQDVQQGLITAAIMRGAGLTPSEKVKTQKWRDNCIGSLPHHRMLDKINHPECPRGYRMEHVYNIDLWAIEAAQRDGR